MLRIFERLDIIDYYELLGVQDDVDYVRIREAYRSTASRLAPERFEGDKQDKLRDCAQVIGKRLQEALGILGDPWLRPRYDKARRKGQSRANESLRKEQQGAEHAERSPFTRHFMELTRSKMREGRAELAIRDLMLALSCDDPPGAEVEALHEELIAQLRGEEALAKSA